MNIKQALESIINTKVISSISGGFTGSLWLIDFEDENSIYIHCSWRIEHNDKILATSNDDITANTGLVTCSVRKLAENNLISFKLTKQYDLELYFENNYSVRIFCDIPSCPENDFHSYRTNWDISLAKEDLAQYMFYYLFSESLHQNIWKISP